MAAEAPPQRQVRLPRGTESVLIVDDEKHLRAVAVSFLEDLGYKTLTANDGKQALEVLKQHDDINLLFCDIIMPGKLDGYQTALAALKSRPSLKVLLASGFASKREIHENGDNKLLAELAAGVLSKPYNQLEMSRTIRNMLDKNVRQG